MPKRFECFSWHPIRATPDHYPCVMFGVRFQGKAMAGVVVQPTLVKTENVQTVRFVFGGMLWVFFLQGDQMNPALLSTCVQPDGSLTFMVNEAETLPDLASFAEARRQLRRE